MKVFNEYAMIAGILKREQDAKTMAKVFKPEWLKTAELKPVLKAIFEYIATEKNHRSPSLESLHAYMAEVDQAKYQQRYKTTLEQLNGVDEKLAIKAIEDGKSAAAAYNLSYIISDARFQQLLTEANADGLKLELAKWLHDHTETDDEGLFTIQEAFDKLLTEYPWQGRPQRMLTGIKAIDEWAGGIRQGQLGLLIAPTGNGKSAALMNIARHGAVMEGKKVLFITNEMSVDEQTERFMVRLQDPRLVNGKYVYVTLSEIQEDPTLAYKNMGTGYQRQLFDNLVIYSAALNQTVDNIEEICQRIRIEKGWFPDIIVIDYMERMSTKEKMNKEQTWTFYGALARELIWLARRRRCAVWTAAQTNRAGMNKDILLSLEHMQGSIQHAQEATLAYTMRKVPVDTVDGEVIALEFGEQKNRFGATSGRRMKLKCDLGRMFISDEEVESIKEIEAAQAAKVKKEGKKAAPLNTTDASSVGARTK